MKTFTIHYRSSQNSQWVIFTDEDNNNVEFVTLNGAKAVAWELAFYGKVYPSRSKDWMIKDSTGKEYTGTDFGFNFQIFEM